MKNKLFYLFGAAFLLCSISIFTACSEEKDEPVVEIPDDGGDNGDDGDALDLNGEYGNNTLKMTYNGEELAGKKVIFTADENLGEATLRLSGTEKNLTDMLAGIMGEVKFMTNSPIPGEKVINLENVILTANADGTIYSFESKDENDSRETFYKGTVKEGEMNIEITNKLKNSSLAGTWELGPLKFSLLENVAANSASPLWIDWDSENNINAGTIANVGFNMDPTSLFTWVFSVGDDTFLGMMGIQDVDVKIQQWIKNLLQSITVQPNGCMYATYSYSGDLKNPAWSSEMSRNIIRYYHGEKSDRVYIEVNTDFILSTLGSLLSTNTRADNQTFETLAKALIETLRPAIENGVPCTYEIADNKLKVNLDGEFTRDVLIKVVDILNEPNINALIMNLIENDETLKTYKPNITTLLQTLPDALRYRDNKETPCEYVKIGLQLVKATE